MGVGAHGELLCLGWRAFMRKVAHLPAVEG
jgi:hypothetical protein